MPVTVKPLPSRLETSDELIKALKSLLADLEDQLNERAQIYVSTDGKIPAGLNINDVILISFQGRISLLLKNRRGFISLAASHIGGLSANETNFLGVKTSGALPTITEFPNNNDWGFHNRTGATLAFYIVFNLGGVIRYREFL